MTAVALHLDVAGTRQPWRALMWLVPLVAFWIALNYWQPGIQASGMPTVTSRVFIHTLLALGLWLGLERSELTPGQRRNVWLAVMIPFTLWLGLIWGAAINGVFRPGVSPIPLLPLAILLPVVIGVPVLLRSRRIGQVLDAMPATWLVALQVYRVLGSVFLIGWVRGAVPGIFALPAGIGDVTTGLLALPVALSLAAGTVAARRMAIAWNVFGLIDFAVAVSIGLAISPGPLQLIVLSGSNGATGGVYPTVMIPAFAVQSSILLHALSLRQLRRRARAAAAAAPLQARALA